MSGFSAEWLGLREPHDLRARNPDVKQAMLRAFRGQASISVVDLACGTGATLRAIGGDLPKRQSWRLADNDLGLLAAAAALGKPPDVVVSARAIDLLHDLELALDGAIDLITTSALLDLVSQEWLERLAFEAAARRLPVYAALTYDGRLTFDPPQAFDRPMIEAVNRHQRGTKTFGLALGPDAAPAAKELLERVGYAFTQGPSDWVLAPSEKPIQCAMLEGFAQAARELGDMPERRIADWLGQRLAWANAGRSSLQVGHIDFFAMPMSIR